MARPGRERKLIPLASSRPPVFNKNAAISYPNFKFSWTINALGQAWKKLPREGW